LSPRQKTELKKQIKKQIESLPPQELEQFFSRAREEAKSFDASEREFAIVALELQAQDQH
jgi:hypothetical protein